jgi:50S ribosomal subunit-associated GTPase HflX
VDASDKKVNEKIKVVDDILDSIKATQTKIYVFNKIDLLSKTELTSLKKSFRSLKPIFVSSFEKIGLEQLKERIMKEI